MPNHQKLYHPPSLPFADVQRGKPKAKQLKRFPQIPVGPSIAYIPLTQGQFALIDVDDVERIGANNWYAQWNCNTQSFYAFREITGRKKLGMHGYLLNPEDGLVPDHINGVTLDNRRSNLRPATKAQNAFNSRIRSDNTTGYKGVSETAGRFEARVRFCGRRLYLGLFPSAVAAHEAICLATAEAHGKFRRAA